MWCPAANTIGLRGQAHDLLRVGLIPHVSAQSNEKPSAFSTHLQQLAVLLQLLVVGLQQLGVLVQLSQHVSHKRKRNT